ncbi:MAG: pyridoxal-phosphate dependent enzyme [Propionibacteriaceae bacterium]|jgi:threonine synthase|nr:pyridoxal-phosphate dependent enzyme [Propionibacteriaceae bacterium]
MTCSTDQTYELCCVACGHTTPDFGAWFGAGQRCPACGANRADLAYSADYAGLAALLGGHPASFWHYRDFLPLGRSAAPVTRGEGTPPLERWAFLEDRARRDFGLDVTVVAARNDLNGGTGTFKDVAASMAASLLREWGVDRFVVASTGNIATAYATYLALAGVRLTAFVPRGQNQASVDEIRRLGQAVRVVDGTYADAKQAAADFAAAEGVLTSAGNIDPIRVESKRTMVFEFLRQLGRIPDVYVQAVSGGTGPIAVDKGIRELAGVGVLADARLPRMVLAQLDTCDPMVQGWERAVAGGFPDGWEKDYPVIADPQTAVTTLATGNPGMYPILAPIVRRSGGTYVRTPEAGLVTVARELLAATGLLLGPASVTCVAGFERALEQGCVKDGDVIVLNTGEGISRAPEFAARVDGTGEASHAVAHDRRWDHDRRRVLAPLPH